MQKFTVKLSKIIKDLKLEEIYIAYNDFSVVDENISTIINDIKHFL